MNSRSLLETFAEDLASVIPGIDGKAEHGRWQPGLGPFEEERQIELLSDAAESRASYTISTEVSYHDNGQRCDLFIESETVQIPIEAKLLRFRYDNGNIDPNTFARIFSPFPERNSSSLLTDVRKLRESEFQQNGGLLGIYYQPIDEEYKAMSPQAIAEKLCLDIEYWYDIEVTTRNIAHFEGLRHPVHQEGAVITWEILE